MNTLQTSKHIAYVLRHNPSSIGLSLDANGWANVDELLQGMNHAGTKIDMGILQNVVDRNVIITINHYTDVKSLDEAQTFWLSLLDLPKSCLRKATINTFSSYSKNKKCGQLLYGTCNLTVHNTEILQRIYGAIQEYAGFSNENWLKGF